ncbi:DUF3293 domain-containing protein [Vibrio coralliilyticus]|uniref:DUF3293 domain-containing protein n=1 Tax=Vibrio coralliilyticus TaxID=190893 RepID=UPI000390F0AF|nr:DUF3293 domain-containing protein [Vibrio coralliilyticus]ERB65416.1 hypothetical protein N779_09985 [Vibrio coralliilyticus OCN008]MCC2524864.1 DUF3293 domain-containing protein [Vibrio coralliilyticus]NOH55296.1 DUF3293 domain-containing protein [Vibrio coralliilyticus]QIJ83079.1 DUF3293 domain-containing protein [Vibrio coralliilyticus OCN008]
MMVDAQLWQEYSDPYFKFIRSPSSHQFAIITAWNPASQWQSKQQNERNNRYLVQEFSHTYFVEVLVGDESFGWAEESFAVDIDELQALELGRKYQQNAIYYVDGNELFLLSCLADKAKVSLGEWKYRCR